MAEKVTIHTSHLSDREYDKIAVERSEGRGFSHSELIGYQDVKTGLLVRDVAKFEAWIKTIEGEHGNH